VGTFQTVNDGAHDRFIGQLIRDQRRGHVLIDSQDRIGKRPAATTTKSSNRSEV
jgi:hypothetical protein